MSFQDSTRGGRHTARQLHNIARSRAWALGARSEHGPRAPNDRIALVEGHFGAAGRRGLVADDRSVAVSHLSPSYLPVFAGPGPWYRARPASMVVRLPAALVLLSERSVPRGRLRPRPGRGSAAQSTHRELNSLPGGLRDPPGCTGDPVPVPSCSACSGRPVPHLSPDLKHSLTRTSPHLKRTRTPSCAFHSNSTSTRSLAACA